ncbi:MAG: glycoside hydrolase family 32 protein [Eubacteriales bacterium]|nr:glycoside hydrolase family 32 protein [Eubacteriales bacterium]
MTSQTLREARKYEETSAKMIKAEERPAFHLSPRTGWTNDPNGFSCYNGQYHLFYQYNPYNIHWGPMHWGHAVSKDMLHWEFLPAALAPDEIFDRDGCFSGSAETLPDGRQLLMYTGVAREPQPDGTFRDVQTQCLAIGDGVDYEKLDISPVLDGNDIPEGSSKADFRDPKMWRNEDGTYSCVVASRPADGSGQILLYSSQDGLSWKFDTILAQNRNRFGKMWECPDFIELDGKHVLLVSPQDMLPKGLEYHNGNGTLCIIGSYDKEKKVFTEEHDQAIDYGIDFYASQTLLTPDGRRVMIGWMQNWDTCAPHSPDQKWFGQMSLPRELSIKNGRLYQQPIKELESLRENKVSYEDVLIEDDTMCFDGVEGRCVDMEISILPEDAQNLYQNFTVRFAQNEDFKTSLSFHPQESVLKIDRKFSGSRRAHVHQRRCLVNSTNGELKLRIILDRFSAEVFVNDGEKVMTITLNTPQEADGISFHADGKVKMNLVKYELSTK